MEYNQTAEQEGNPNCLAVVFSDRAYNLIIGESFKKDPLETGGILLGHILDNGVWLVLEVLPPGPKSIFERAYFEYDFVFVNYLAQSIAEQYNLKLELLGLWHRHPGSFDQFSSTDDTTNSTFAKLNSKGAISGLVNIDPNFRFTMYHVDPVDFRYTEVEIAAGDEMIPEEYFELKYYPHGGMHPSRSYRKDFMMHQPESESITTDDTTVDMSSAHDPLHENTELDNIDLVLQANNIQVGIENILDQVNTMGRAGNYVFQLEYDTDWFLEIIHRAFTGEETKYKAYIRGFVDLQKQTLDHPIYFTSPTGGDIEKMVEQSIQWLEQSFRILLDKKGQQQ